MAITKEVNIVVKESGMDKVNQSISQLENAVHDTEQATKSFKTQMREANQELLKMSQKFGETSKEAVQAAKKVADLKDQMGLANDLVNSFNPDQKFKALGAATQVAGTGLQGVTAGMALFGEQSEDTQKTLLQVQAAMSFSDAISNLSNLGDQWVILKTAIQNSSVAQKVYVAATGAAAIVQKLFTGSVATTTLGFKLLRGALIATGIGALVVGVGLLIANFDKVKKVVLNFIPGLAQVGDMVMNIVNSITDFIGVTSEAGRLVDKQKEVAEKALKQNEAYLKKNEHKLSEARKRELELSQEHYQRIIDGEMSQEESLKILREKAQIDKQKKQDEANKIQSEKDKTARDKAKADAQKAIEDAKKAAEDERKQKSDLAKERGENAREELEKLQQIEKDIKKQNEDALKTENELKVEQENTRYEALKQKMIDANVSTIEIEKEHKRNLFAIEEEDRIKREEAQKEKDATDEENAEKERQRAKAVADFKEQQLKNSYNDLQTILSVGGKKMQQISKALAVIDIARDATKSVTQTVSATGAANAAATAASPLTAGMPFVGINTLKGALSIGATVASAAKSIQAITSDSKSVSSGGGSSVGSSSAPQAPSFNLVQGTGTNQIAQSITNQAPVKAFVVARDMSTGQEMDRNIIKSASL